MPQLLKVQCPNILDFWNPCGKVMERSGLRFEKKNCLYKVWNCHNFFFYLNFFLLFFCKYCLTSWICLVLVLLFASVKRCFVSRIQDFFCSTYFCNIRNTQFGPKCPVQLISESRRGSKSLTCPFQSICPLFVHFWGTV